MTNNNFDLFIKSISVLPIIKIIIIVFLLLYLIFSLVAFVNIRSLDKLVVINAGRASKVVQSIYIFYLVIVVALFLAAIVIL